MPNMKFNGLRRSAFKYSKEAKEGALETAIKTRQFEIELYWKRATYYWGFTAAIFVAYFAIWAAGGKDPSSGFLIQQSFFQTVVSGLGFVFSLGWLLANKGSKYWQDNWESMVAALEDDQIGPVFKTVLTKDNCNRVWDWSYPISVTRINVLISLFTTVIWLGLFVISLLPTGEGEAKIDWPKAVYVVLVALFSILLLCVTGSAATSKTEIRRTFETGAANFIEPEEPS